MPEHVMGSYFNNLRKFSKIRLNNEEKDSQHSKKKSVFHTAIK